MIKIHREDFVINKLIPKKKKAFITKIFINTNYIIYLGDIFKISFLI